MEAKLIQVTSTATKYANKSFLCRLGDFFPHFSLGVEGWLWTGWVISFGGFDCFLRFVVVGGRNELGSSLLTLVLTPLNHFLTYNSSLKMNSQICNLIL
jgi:hypothetical protein